MFEYLEKEGICHRHSVQTLEALTFVTLFQLCVVLFSASALQLEQHHGKDYFRDCCKYRCKKRQRRDDTADDDTVNGQTQDHVTNIVFVLRSSTLLIMFGLIVRELLFGSGGLILAWNNMLLHTMFIPAVYVYIGGVLSITKHVGDLIALQQRTKQHAVPFFFFLAVFPFLSVYILAEHLLPLLQSFSNEEEIGSESTHIRWSTQIKGFGPALVVGITSLRIVHAMFVSSIEEFLIEKGTITTMTDDNGDDNGDDGDEDGDGYTNTSGDLRMHFLNSDHIFWWFARFGIYLFYFVCVQLPANIITLASKTCSCCVGKCFPPASALHFMFVRFPFTYNFIQLTAIYGIGLFNLLFHLLSSTTWKNEPMSTTFLKFLIFFCVGYNFLPILFQLVATAHDSWKGFPYLSQQTGALLRNVEMFVDGNYTRRSQRLLRHKQLQPLVRRHSQEQEQSAQVFKLIHQSISSIVWLLVALFAGIALLARVQTGDTGNLMKLRNVSDDNGMILELTIDHSIGRVKLFNANTIDPCYKPLVRENCSSRFRPYGICSQKYHNLSILDYSLLSNMVYYLFDNLDSNMTFQEESLYKIQTVLNFTFPSPLYNVTLVDDRSLGTIPKSTTSTFTNNNNSCYGDDIHQGAGGPARGPEKSNRSNVVDCRKCKTGGATKRFEQFVRFDFHDRKVAVVAIKGTSPLELLDIIADVRLWSESVLIQVISTFLPTISLFSAGAIMQIIKGIQKFQKYFEVLNIDLDFHRNIIRYIHCVHSQLPNGWHIAVTGHSLGGGLATIAGATLDIHSIAFSPPGFVKSRGKFDDPVLVDDDSNFRDGDGDGDGRRKTDRNSPRRPRLVRAAGKALSLIPTRDLVTKADSHFGLTQDLLCMQDNPLLCHQLERTVCDLLRRCGDDHNGQRFSSCQYEVASMTNMIELSDDIVKNVKQGVKRWMQMSD